MSGFKNILSKTPKGAQKSFGGRQNLEDRKPLTWRFPNMALHHRPFPRKPWKFQDDSLKEQQLVFQRFTEFHLETFIIFNFQKLFLHRIFRNGRNALPWYGASDWKSVFRLTKLKWFYAVVGCGEIRNLVWNIVGAVWDWFIHKDKVI